METGGALTSGNMIGVRFRITGRIYYFAAGEFDVHRGDHVIVETVRGMEYGYVVADPPMLASKRSPKPLKTILRIAGPADDEQAKANRVREREALRICQPRIREHGLEMKLIDAEYTFDNSKLLFYFTADGRVDFRELVKDLATIFRMRIELRQIGVRDETQILGGYGICGRVLCCHSFLSDFAPVSIKMAKEQSLSLNQTKISGVCGRLMCCLKNEEETYEELKRSLPGVGDEVEGNDGLTGEVSSVNVLRQTIKILVEVDDEKELHEYGEGEWTLIRKRRRGQARHPKKEQEKQPVQKNENRQENPADAAGTETENRSERRVRQKIRAALQKENGEAVSEMKSDGQVSADENGRREQQGQSESGNGRRRQKDRKNRPSEERNSDAGSGERRSGRNGGRNRKRQDAAASQENAAAADSGRTQEAPETENRGENQGDGQGRRRRGGHFNRRRRGGSGRGNGNGQGNDAGTES
ncbi:MAG: hypothetical protein J6P87_05330 [Lachnospiraceae bacterium]|nr:hypothetical protein [Lachnospiraceae bacterium]